MYHFTNYFALVSIIRTLIGSNSQAACICRCLRGENQLPCVVMTLVLPQSSKWIWPVICRCTGCKLEHPDHLFHAEYVVRTIKKEVITEKEEDRSFVL